MPYDRVCVFLTFCFLTSALVICIGFGLHGESLLEVGRRPDNTKSGLCVCVWLSYVVPPWSTLRRQPIQWPRKNIGKKKITRFFYSAAERERENSKISEHVYIRSYIRKTFSFFKKEKDKFFGVSVSWGLGGSDECHVLCNTYWVRFFFFFNMLPQFLPSCYFFTSSFSLPCMGNWPDAPPPKKKQMVRKEGRNRIGHDNFQNAGYSLLSVWFCCFGNTPKVQSISYRLWQSALGIACLKIKIAAP